MNPIVHDLLVILLTILKIGEAFMQLQKKPVINRRRKKVRKRKKNHFSKR